ncbi:putative transmembrane domain-containing protein [Cryptosporidium canis]|uniref:Transmembrane domain-containing protein n=1 Tax=Cryptosporidium canis TaxID=195482 RepID=A0ABQ8P3J2_9CRYT|nr:putative transmembrane domain-containing protein [Cryptosporidium canis]
MVESSKVVFQEGEKKTSVSEEEVLGERRRELSIISKGLGAITLVSVLMNLCLVGAMIFVVNSLIKGIISEQSSQMAIQKGLWSSFAERNSRVEKGSQHGGENVEGYYSRNRAGVIPLHMLYNAPLNSLENVDAIILEFDDPELEDSANAERKVRGKRHQHMYHVESIEREILMDEKEATLKFKLTNEGTLQVHKDKAILMDRLGNVIHEISFGPIHDHLGHQEKLLRSDPREEGSESPEQDQPVRRKLISSNSHKHSAAHSLKTQSGYMAAVCKYGCGEMGITYPYYYRPFFGYGFPLLGTEPYFQSGYGGSVETAMNNNMFNPESASPRPPGLQATPQTSPFSMTDNPYNYPYSSSPGGGYYYYNYNNYYPPPPPPPSEPFPYYEDNYYFNPQNSTQDS